ncbi:metallophosphoesterase [Butyrivibrio sp. AE3004]|uniref:metallophosphoesterase n=1 Tax=Butyrivibrio sp. AE3004 TaxID=1506994 RepID=UPI0009DD7C14|nr:metallophosphoesterase [Butyrivibrio sp. AE3004]
MATYAISDLHGQYDLFQKLLDVIHFSDDDFMYVLGDAIDRGPDGIKILHTMIMSMVSYTYGLMICMKRI